MTNQEILKNVLKKASLNGFNLNKMRCLRYFDSDSVICIPEVVIFDHDFAKAFWGEKQHKYFKNSDGYNKCKFCSSFVDEHAVYVGEYCWQQKLSDMVLSNDPLKYLEKFL